MTDWKNGHGWSFEDQQEARNQSVSRYSTDADKED